MKSDLYKRSGIKNLREGSQGLGLQITRGCAESRLSLNQSKNVTKNLNRFQIVERRLVNTPWIVVGSWEVSGLRPT